jgi:hypothetical protein
LRSSLLLEKALAFKVKAEPATSEASKLISLTINSKFLVVSPLSARIESFTVPYSFKV